MPETMRNREDSVGALDRGGTVPSDRPSHAELGTAEFGPESTRFVADVRETLRLISETGLPPVDFLRENNLIKIWLKAADIAVDIVPHSSNPDEDLRRLTQETGRLFERLAMDLVSPSE